jgi:hypothetical protein
MVGNELPDTWRPLSGEFGYHVCSDLCECRYRRAVPAIDTGVFEWSDLELDD